MFHPFAQFGNHNPFFNSRRSYVNSYNRPQRPQRSNEPRFQVEEFDDKFIIYTSSSSINSNSINLSINGNGDLIIQGYLSGSWQPFRKIFELPDDVDAENIAGRFKRNLFLIEVPKSTVTASRIDFDEPPRIPGQGIVDSDSEDESQEEDDDDDEEEVFEYTAAENDYDDSDSDINSEIDESEATLTHFKRAPEEVPYRSKWIGKTHEVILQNVPSDELDEIQSGGSLPINSKTLLQAN